MPELQLPLVSGQHEELDSRVAPDGVLRSVKELVTKRQGRWEKRNDYAAVTATVSPTAFPDLSTAALDGEIWSLNSFRGGRLISHNRPPEMRILDSTTNKLFSPADGKVGLPIFSAAQRYPVPHELGDGSTDLVHTDIVHVNGWTVVGYQLGTAIRVAWIDEATQQTVFVSSPILATSGQAFQMCLAGDYVVLAYPSGGDIVGRVWDSTSTSTPGFSAAHAIMTSPAAITSTNWVIAEYRGQGLFLLAGHSSVLTTIEVDLFIWDPADVAALGAADDSNTGLAMHTGDGSGFLALDGSSDGIVLVSSDPVTEIRYRTFDGSLVDQHGNTQVTALTTFTGVPSLLQYDADEWLLAIERTISGTGYTTRATGMFNLTFAGTAGSLLHHYEAVPASQLFNVADADGTVRPFLIVSAETDTATTGSQEFTTNYYAIDVRHERGGTAQPVTSLQMHAFFGRDVAIHQDKNTQLPKVAVTSGGRYLHANRYIAQGTALDRDGYGEAYRQGTAIWRFDSSTRDKHHMTPLGQAGYMSGGIMTRWNGMFATESGFLRRPDIISLTEGTTGSLTQGGTYTYLVVYESILNDGEVVRSEPSLPATITLTSTNDDVTLVLRDNKLRSNPAYLETPHTKIYVYRTVADVPGIYYLVHGQDDPTIGEELSDSTEVSFVDTASDATIEDNVVIYSAADGTGLLPNVTPPPCKFIATVGKRLICGGLENPNEVWLSAEHVAGEAANFKDDPAFKAQVPDPVTAVGELDGYPVVFTANGVYSLLGQGPDDTGVGVFELRQIPTDLGAVTHHVFTTDEGLLYQSGRGIELLPRGFGPPQWIGQSVSDTLGSNLITSAVGIGEDDVRFTYADGASGGGVLVWNSTWNTWSVFELGDIYSAADWGGFHALGYVDFDAAVPLRLETTTPPATYINGSVETVDIRMGMIAGYYRARELVTLWEYQGQARITIAISYNEGQSFPDSVSKDLDSGTYTAGDIVPISVTLPWQKADRFRFRLTDSGYNGTTTGTAGVRYLGMTLNFQEKRGVKRLQSALRG